MSTSVAKEIRYKGLALSAGITLGQVCQFRDQRAFPLPMYPARGITVEQESRRLQRACRVVHGNLDLLRIDIASRLGPQAAAIFESQQALLDDPVVISEILHRVQVEGISADAAVAETMTGYEVRLQAAADEYLSQRSSDIGELRDGLLAALNDIEFELHCEECHHCRKGVDRIVLAEQLTPMLTVQLDVEHTMGFVTERGGPGSHAAILARSLGIPAVSGLTNIRNIISCGSQILLDGNRGEVILNPSEQTLRAYAAHLKRTPKAVIAVEPVSSLRVMANISRVVEVEEVLAMKAEGIGLYRTEFDFMAAGRVLTEEEQLERYRHVIERMGGLPVCFRLLDLGGDKQAPFLGLPVEQNPYLGFRGARLLLGRPDLLRAQARALVRAASAGPIKILYPMVVDAEQYLLLRAQVDEATSDLDTRDVEHGVMLEVPSACLEAERLLPLTDFASIGTNDLIQYLFAVNRNNELVAADYHPNHRVFWRLMEQLVEAARRAERSLSVCGEIAVEPAHLARLMRLGIREVSVNARQIPLVRRAAELAAGG